MRTGKLHIPESYTVAELRAEFDFYQLEIPKELARKKKERKSEARCGMITRTRTCVTVMWQDATREEGVPSISLIPLHDLLDADFWPQDFVQEVRVCRVRCVACVCVCVC